MELTDVEAALTLFTEGIAGSYYHIKAASEFASPRLDVPPDEAALALDTVYLPDTLDYPDPAGYRVLVMLQLGQREFGTFRFDLDTARARIPALGTIARTEPALRESDFSALFRQVGQPRLLKRLFSTCERARISVRLLDRYPGLKPHHQRFQAARYDGWDSTPGVSLAELLIALDAAADGLPTSGWLDATGLLEPALERLDTLSAASADVYDAVAVALDIYHGWQALLEVAAEGPAEQVPLDEDALEWLQREARLEDWEQDLNTLEETLSVELLEAGEVNAALAEDLTDGEIREEDIDIKALSDQRDNLKRRLDMERSAIRDALGPARPEARSFRYDEWDHLERRYLRHWCRLFEERLAGDSDVEPAELTRIIQQHSAAVMRRLEQIRPLGFQRVRRVQDGDELDFNALIESRQDVRAGISPDERVYSRRDRVHRDVCAAFLVDLSASTDDPVEPPEPALPAPEGAAPVNLRDPYDDDPFPVNHELSAEPPRRRIIDLQRESMLVMSAALERLGDSYGIYGFSGYGRDCVEFYVAKEPAEPFTGRTLEAIASMKPRRSTRMGPAIRHTTAKLLASGNALKLMVILSDGFPQDSDYGPVRGDHEWGLQDTARAIREAHDKGVEIFCVTVDKSGHDYLKRMCPESRYLIIEEIEDLPEQLSKVYQALTGR